MAKRVVWTDEARADLLAIEQDTELQILNTPAHYAVTGGGPIKLRTTLRPVLRGVIYSHDFHAVRGDTIDGDIRQRREQQLSGSILAS
jgi:hypothetical protein